MLKLQLDGTVGKFNAMWSGICIWFVTGPYIGD